MAKLFILGAGGFGTALAVMSQADVYKRQTLIGSAEYDSWRDWRIFPSRCRPER